MSSEDQIISQHPIPRAPIEAYQRSFLIDARGKVEVTAVDVSNHGMFLVVGCSNGAVLLYNLTKRQHSAEGIYLGQINCKGIHSVMSMKVKISDDCRFCFAGVIRGSNELLAIDLSHLQWGWKDFDAQNQPSAKGKKGYVIVKPDVPTVTDLFETFIMADAKLKGFGACCSKFTDTTKSESGVTGHQYLLASGLGIKNVHVWELTVYDEPVSFDASVPARKDHWKCIYDVATNGNTITHLGFRNFGRELITKSGTFNIRVWDTSKYKEEPNNKPAYEDIANSQDVKCLLETSDFAYGGIYEFSMVKVDKNIPKEANRNIFELPDKALPESQYEESVRRRRTMREVVDVVGTQDGEHVLVKVADGGVLHFHHPRTTHMRSDSLAGGANENVDTNQTRDDLGTVGHLQELPSPAKEGDMEQAWTVKRVGNEGLVVVARAFFRPDPKEKDSDTPGIITGLGNATPAQQKGMTVLSIFPLSHLGQTLSTMSMIASEHSLRRWHPTGSFYRSPRAMLPEPAGPETAQTTAEAAVAATTATVDTAPSMSNPADTAAEKPTEDLPSVPGTATKSPKVVSSVLVPAILYPMDEDALQAASAISTPHAKTFQSPAGVASAGVFASGADVNPPAIKKRKANQTAEVTFTSPTATTSTSSSAQKTPLPPTSSSSLARQTSSSSSGSSTKRNHVQSMFEDAAAAAGLAPEDDEEQEPQPAPAPAKHPGRPRGSKRQVSAQQYIEDIQGMVAEHIAEVLHEPVEQLPYPAITIHAVVPPSTFTPSTLVLPICQPTPSSTDYSILTERNRLSRAIDTLVSMWSEQFRSDHYPAECILFTGPNEVLKQHAATFKVGSKRPAEASWVVESNKRRALSITVPPMEPSSEVSSSASQQWMLTSLLVQSLGVFALHQYGRILTEQERMKSLLVQEIKRLIAAEKSKIVCVLASQSSGVASAATMVQELQTKFRGDVLTVVRRYQTNMVEELVRQRGDFVSARHRDQISQVDPISSAQTMGIALTPKSREATSAIMADANVQVHFRYVDILERTMDLAKDIFAL